MAQVRYVEFVRKIADCTIIGGNLEKCKKMAAAAGFRYMSFNGYIWYLTEDLVWIELHGLKISDFEV